MKLRYVLGLGLLFILMMISSTMSFNDELLEENQYIDNVCKGVWPDFKNLTPSCSNRLANQP